MSRTLTRDCFLCRPVIYSRYLSSSSFQLHLQCLLFAQFLFLFLPLRNRQRARSLAREPRSPSAGFVFSRLTLIHQSPLREILVSVAGCYCARVLGCRCVCGISSITRKAVFLMHLLVPRPSPADITHSHNAVRYRVALKGPTMAAGVQILLRPVGHRP